MYAVKVKAPDAKIWHFLSGKGGMNRLKIHAAQFKEKALADKVVAEIERENDGFKAKVVKPWKD